VYQQLFGTASRVLESVLLVFFYLIFLLLDAHRIPGRFRRAFPEHAHKFQQGFRKISDEIGNYMWIKTLISAGMAVCAGVVMALFGMTDALLWVCLTFLLNYITYVGSLAALVPPIAIALLQFNSLWGALAFAALLCLNRSIWTDYMEIRFSGHQLRLNNVLLLFIIIFWGWFWGVIGMVLAVPILSALKIILAQFERTRAWSILMSED
jgi:predicted PurR-regulated permease PerM